MPGVPAVTPAGRGFTDSVCVSISSNRIRRLAPESQTRDLTGGFGAAPEHPASPGLWQHGRRGGRLVGHGHHTSLCSGRARGKKAEKPVSARSRDA